MTEATLFFPKTVHREVVIKNSALLVGKAPEKAKRIKIQLSMPLSGKTSVGMPGWLGDAYEFVAKTNNLVPLKNANFPGANLLFSSDDLFSTPAKAPKSQLRKFTVASVGSAEDPDVELQFFAYVPFATDLWAWLGQFAGDEVWANFDIMQGASPDEAVEDEDEDEDDEEEHEERGPNDEEDGLFVKENELLNEFEAERKEACSPEHDAEFAPGVAPTEQQQDEKSEKPKPRRPRGF